jgi:SAM-dependent methyltransferase
MKKELLNIIVCPSCKENLELKAFKENEREVQEGVLVCSNGHFFPVVNYIPRLLCRDLRAMLYKQFPDFFSEYKDFLPREEMDQSTSKEAQKKKETSESFAYEWQKFSKMIQEWKKNFDFYFGPVKRLDALKDKTILEVGCGKGRHTFYAAKIAREVVAVDFGRSVDVALLNNKSTTNVHFVQADIYNMPFRNNSFDFIFCLGVLHHLPTPEQGFKKLVDLLATGGGILIYVYHSFSKKTVKYYLLGLVTFIRRFTTRISHKLLYVLCYPIAFFSYLIFILPYKIFFRRFVKNGWPLGSYSEYPFEVILNDTFDRFSAPIENRYSKDQIVKWYQNAELKDINILGGFGWRIFGKK